ncbi:MAG TPA: efflux RND transporter periplasmic adaptor subunit [Bacteroidaceae bacterium]|nr:efflux RND transporter periplasmic adaptor subunit [Bacteroidaceae bacterium]
MKKIFLFVPICILPLLLTSCGKKQATKTQTVFPVKAVHPQMDQQLSAHTYIGLLEGNKSSSLSFQVPGQVETILVQEGQKVQKGQLLATLDASTLQHQYDASEATLAQAQDAMRRMQVLYDNGSLPEIKYVEVKTRVQQAKSAFGIAKRNLGESKLYAAFTGIIGSRAVQVGENVLPGQRIFTLIDISRLKVAFDVPEEEIAHIQIGNAASVSVGALDNQSFKASISERRLDANKISHNYTAYVTIKDDIKDLAPGMACVVTLCTHQTNTTTGESTEKTPIVLPISAVQVTLDKHHYVWLAKDGQAVRREVKIGGLVPGGLTIEDGLSSSDWVITEGYHKLSNGSKIKINE